MKRVNLIALGVGVLVGLGAVAASAGPAHRLTVAEFGAGCVIPPVAQWPDDVRRGFYWMGRVRAAVDEIVGAPTVVTSGWRPRACNTDREGQPASRHLRGWAIDLQLVREQRARLVAWLRSIGADRGSSSSKARKVGDALRRLIGWRGFVGVRIYASGNLHVDLGCHPANDECAPRSADWFENLYS